MATTIVTKYGSDAPATTDIVRGELAVDTENGRLYTENAAGAVVEIGLKPEANVDVTGTITATGTSVFASLDISGDIDVDGTTNLDVVDIDGAVDFASTTAHAGNATFADNAKAIFGAGSDLEIYHTSTGNHSIIEEVGGGNLVVRTNGPHIEFDKGSTEYMARMLVDGAVELYYDSALKLVTTSTGIDVTGTATMDGLTVDGNIAFTDSGSSNRNVLYLDGSDNVVIATGTTAGTRGIDLYTNNSKSLSVAESGDISFYEDTGTTAKLTWDASAEMLTTSGLTVSKASGDIAVLAGTTAASDVEANLVFNPIYDVNARIVSAREGAALASTLSFETGVDNTGSTVRRQHIASNGDISFFEDTGTTAKFFWDASAERIGLGTTSPVSELDIAGTTPTLTIKDTQNKSWTSSDTTLGELAFRTSDASGIGAHDVAFVRAVNEVASSSTPSGALSFGISASNANAAEAMRIDSSGNLLVGKTSASAGSGGVRINNNGTYGGRIELSRENNTGTQYSVQFYDYAGSTVGSISNTTTATSYNTSSDQRLKDNIADADDAGSKVDAIKVRKFDWKADGEHQDYGMIAQELIEVAPEAVSQGETEEEMMGVDYSKLVPMLVKEIQQLRQRVAQLEE